MTGRKGPLFAEDRATSLTIRWARISLYFMGANEALGSSVPDANDTIPT